jgi:arginase family enzyme
MEISIYFEPVKNQNLPPDVSGHRALLGRYIMALDESFDEDDLAQFDAVIVGVNEERGAVNNAGCDQAPDDIRRALYSLSAGSWKLKIGDMGNIRPGENISDTYFALRDTIYRLLRSGVVPIVIGGSEDLSLGVYAGYEQAGRIINLVSVDSRLNYDGSEVISPDATNFLSSIFFGKPNCLFNFANLGYQSYFTDIATLQAMNNLFFDTWRLGLVRQNMEEAEPVIRNADYLSFDISAVRYSDAPGNGNASPNGFMGDEACQLVRYAGISSKLSCIGFYETNPLLDPRGQTTLLTAQMIWYFLDGLAVRLDEYPDDKHDNFVKYIVDAGNIGGDMVFFKSKITSRWWMQLPVSREKEKDLQRHIMVPCTYADYQQAAANEIPDRWWKAYQKLM